MGVELQHENQSCLAGWYDADALGPAARAELRPRQQVLEEARWRVHCAAEASMVSAHGVLHCAWGSVAGLADCKLSEGRVLMRQIQGNMMKSLA